MNGSLRVLVIQNLYPPYSVGGYQQACRIAVDGLRARGHAVTVLTSRFGLSRPVVQGHVWRVLEPNPSAHVASRWPLPLREWHNHRVLRRVLSREQPHLVSVWSMSGLAKSLLVSIQRAGIPITYNLHDRWLLDEYPIDPWLSFWGRLPSRLHRRVGKRVLRALGFASLASLAAPIVPDPLDLRYVVFCSHSRKEQYRAALSVDGASVIYGGVDTTHFCPASALDSGCRAPLRLLFLGRIEFAKGLHTILEALDHLSSEHRAALTLDIAGPAHDPAYTQRVAAFVDNAQWTRAVRWLGPVDYARVPDCYRAHDVFVFSSIGEEGFPLSVLEAMGSGLAVVSTCTGGHTEILADGINCLTYPAGDAQALAECLRQLLDNPGLRHSIASAGLRLVRERFGVERMLDQIEAYYLSIVSRAEP